MSRVGTGTSKVIRDRWMNLVFNVFLTLLFLNVSVRAASGNSDIENQLICQKFTAEEAIINLIETGVRKSTPCACVEQKMALDYSFRKIGNCFRQWFFQDGVKQMCCYNEDGNLQVGAPNGGYISLENMATNISDVHMHCCQGDKDQCNLFYAIIPSDDCSRYQPPTIVTSWGDPQIETIDKTIYDFNGHGEYVFLQTSQLEIQARTDYVTPGNNDSTIFTAFVMYDSSKYRIELHLERKTGDILVYNSGRYVCNSSQIGLRPCISSFGSCKLLVGGGQVLVLNCIGEFAKKVQFTGNISLGIEIQRKTNISHSFMRGLAGGNVNGSLVARNDTLYSNMSTPKEFFEFGETWRLQNKTESKFTYSIDHTSFDYYHDSDTRPTFFEDYINNLTVLFNLGYHNHSKKDIELFNRTCKGYKECLLAIARSDDLQLGREAVKKIEHAQYVKELYANVPPQFTKNMPTNVTIILGDNSSFSINLTEYTYDKNSNDVLRFSILTTIPKDDYTLKDGLFNWMITKKLRNVPVVTIRFFVQDKFNISAKAVLQVKFCGCEHGSKECTFQDSESIDCVCLEGYSGSFCENKTDPCTVANCFEQSKCNSSAEAGVSPCSPCPIGYEGDGSDCSDVDECATKYNGTDKCDQMCNNTIGSFDCSCLKGFDQIDRHICIDINECAGETKPCDQTEICDNLPGSYSCQCAPGYSRATEHSSCKAIVGYTYVGYVSFTILTTSGQFNTKLADIDNKDNRETIRNKLDERFTGTVGYISVDVIHLTIKLLHGNTRMRRKSEDKLFYELDVKYVVHWKNQTNNTASINTALVASYENSTKYSNDEPISLGDIKVTSQIVKMAVKNTLCDVADQIDCDLTSTTCVDVNGGFQCQCKSGYQSAPHSNRYCVDINECNWPNIMNLCKNGQCRNTIGSWNCNCPSKVYTTPKSIGDSGDRKFRCEGDFQYIGKMSVKTDSTKNLSIITDILNQTIPELFENDNTNLTDNNITEKTPLSDIFWNFEILKSPPIGNMTDSVGLSVMLQYILHIGEPVTTIWLEAQQNVTLNNRKIASAGINLIIQDSSIFNESGYNLCNITGKTKCIPETTVCKVDNGSYTCPCRHGYNRLNPYFCKDIDECARGSVTCHNGGTCRNTAGSWSCDCPNGFKPEDINETSMNCTDINECSDNRTYTCQGPENSATCINTYGGWECDCGKGFNAKNLSMNYRICEDINECNNPLSCKGGECRNRNGGFYCDCPEGFVNNTNTTIVSGDVHITCTDINECRWGNMTTQLCIMGTCKNMPGSWECNCPNAVYNKRKTIGQGKQGRFRCEGDFQYIGKMSVITDSTKNLSIITDILNQKIPELFESDNTNLTDNNITEKTPLSDIFWKIEILKSSPTGNLTDSVGLSVMLQYILHIGEPVTTIWLEAQQNVTLNNRKIASAGINLIIQDSSIFNESGYNLCNITGKTKCMPETTVCKVDNGSYTCPCRHGYNRLNPYFCKDIDECTRGSVTCHNGGTCRNTAGSWSCDCPNGFKPEDINETSINCTDINECSDNRTYTCQGPENSATCINTYGGWECDCGKGFNAKNLSMNYRICEDINECNNPLSCKGGECRNRGGGFYCDCPEGFVNTTNTTIVSGDVHITCTDINECRWGNMTTQLCIMGTCKNMPGSWECNCPNAVYNKRKTIGQGKQGRFRCEGDFQYIGLFSLFPGPSTLSVTDAVWKAVLNETISPFFSQTTNITTSMRSGDPPMSDIFLDLEYLNISTSTSQPIDMLYILHIGEAMTTAWISSFQNKTFNKNMNLGADRGYLTSAMIYNESSFNLCSITGRTECELSSTHCTVHNGSYSCPCNPGYSATEDPHRCQDEDECKRNGTNQIVCESGLCQNTIGSWQCQCDTWSEFVKINNTHGTCQDKNECNDRINYICKGGDCMNKIGGWDCTCENGLYAAEFTKNQIYSCTDIDECSGSHSHTCSNGGTCVNIVGNWTCDCPKGLEIHQINASAIACNDVDECQRKDRFKCEGDNNSANCTNSFGSWACSCRPGYDPRNISESVRVCEDIDECADGSYSCVGGVCINTIGSWFCDCPSGYTNSSAAVGSRHVTCENIDECDSQTACIEALNCEDTDGSWKCICSEGLKEKTINETSKICEGEYQYVASVSFILTGNIVDIGKIQTAIREKILDMYVTAFGDSSVWIEILQYHGLPGSSRNRRSVPRHDITADYIVHTSTEKSQNALQEVETVYKNTNCNNSTHACTDELLGLGMQLSAVQTKNYSAICDTNKNICDKKSSTCYSRNGQIECSCSKGYTKAHSNSVLCIDIDECKTKDTACQNGSKCTNTVGSWDCSCGQGLKAVENPLGVKHCEDLCFSSKCFTGSECSYYENDNGYICGCEEGRKGDYCEEIDTNFKDSEHRTMLIAVGCSLGGLVIILIGVILVVCRWRAAKIKEAEKISMKYMDTNTFKDFDGSLINNQHQRIRSDDEGWISSHSFPRHHRRNSHGDIFNHVNTIQQSLHHSHYKGSMPNLANGVHDFDRSDIRRFSSQEQTRSGINSTRYVYYHSGRTNAEDGRVSPLPDYDQSPSMPSPKPDYDNAERLDASRDSGVGNGHSSGSLTYEYRRHNYPRVHQYEQRESNTKF